jgi:PAS domain-containing protein
MPAPALFLRRLRVHESKCPSEHSAVPPDGELLWLIFESATDFAIFTMDPNGITTSWNPGGERLLGSSTRRSTGNRRTSSSRQRKAVLKRRPKNVAPHWLAAVRKTNAGRCARTVPDFGHRVS